MRKNSLINFKPLFERKKKKKKICENLIIKDNKMLINLRNEISFKIIFFR